MNLKEYVDELLGDLAAFEKHWRKQAKINPEQWPLEMEPGDWHEQFLMWLNTGPDGDEG